MSNQSITCKELNSVIQNESNLSIFDVRKKPAFNSDPSTLPTATWQDFEQVEQWSKELSDDQKKDLVVVYCVHGHEVSQSAARALNSLGFNAKYLDGGIAAWNELGFTTED